jgi:hypothetical protein
MAGGQWLAMVIPLLVSTVVMIASAQSATGDHLAAQKTQAPSYWIDPSTGLMWAGKDNGKDISWRGAMKYCRVLRLAGFSDWRLANSPELQSMYDKNAEAPGLVGYAKALRPFTWHVKGHLFLTGEQWSGHQVTGRMPLESYEFHFNFDLGRFERDPSGWPYPSSGMRALCVRGPDK